MEFPIGKVLHKTAISIAIKKEHFMKAAVESLDQAISNHPFRPKGIKVGTELWKVLNETGRIKWKRG